MEIDGRAVVGSGSFVVGYGQSLSFRPIATSQDFKLELDIRLAASPEPASISVVAGDDANSAKILVCGGYHDGIHVINEKYIKFVSDSKRVYYGNFSVRCAGVEDKFSSVFIYTILSTEKSDP